MSVVVFLAESDAEYNNESLTAIVHQHQDDIASGFISVIQVLSSYYPQLSNLKRNFGDAPDRVQWRAKQVADYSLLFIYSLNISEYYIQLEDDVHSAIGFVKSVRQYIGEQNRIHSDWAVLEFSELGFIGKLFRSSDLQHLAEFMMMFYVEQPVDWLFRYFKLAMNQQLTYLRKPTVFQHFGTKSSFDLSKDNVLKDRLVRGFVLPGLCSCCPSYRVWVSINKKRKRKVLPKPYGPSGSANLRFVRPSARHQFLHCETTDTGPVYRAVYLFKSQQ